MLSCNLASFTIEFSVSAQKSSSEAEWNQKKTKLQFLFLAMKLFCVDWNMENYSKCCWRQYERKVYFAFNKKRGSIMKCYVLISLRNEINSWIFYVLTQNSKDSVWQHEMLRENYFYNKKKGNQNLIMWVECNEACNIKLFCVDIA